MRPRTDIVEVLRFTVRDGCGEAFVRRNREVWLAPLTRHPGFDSATIVENRESSNELLILISWRSQSDCDAFPRESIAALEAQMDGVVAARSADICLVRDWFATSADEAAPP
jgi:uncharacterized protein (TIGR03792 family)